MTVAASTLIATSATPTQDQLWDLAYIFTANWDKGIAIHQSFMTDVTKSQSDLEQRRGLITSPERVFEADILISGAEQIGYFRSFLMRASMSRFLFPIHTDRVRCVTGGAGTVSYASGALTDRRYMIGGRIAVVKFNAQRIPTSIQVTTIVGITSTFISCVGSFVAVDSSYYIFPLIEAELLLEQTTSVISGNVLRATLTAVESRGDFSLDALQAISTNPGGVSYNGFPVLTIEPDIDSASMGMQRSGEYTQNGRGKVLQIFGVRGRFTHELRFLQLNRTNAFKVVRWFEAMAGRLNAFYLLSPCADFQPVSFTGTTVTVKSSMIVGDWTFYPAIGVLMTDGTYQIRLIVGTPTVSGSNYVITVAAWSVTPTLATIRRMSVATLVRFDTDEMVEEWATDGVMTSSLKFVELPIETPVLTIANIKDFTQGYF